MHNTIQPLIEKATCITHDASKVGVTHAETANQDLIKKRIHSVDEED